MRAVFSPGPSYSNPETRKYAGWLHIYDLMRECLEELKFDVFVPQVPPELIDPASTVSKITSWDLVAAHEIPEDVQLFVGPPGYSLAQILRLREMTSGLCQLPEHHHPNARPKVVTVVFNNADWWRDQQLKDEYAAFGFPYDLSPTWRWINKTALELSDCVIACSPFVKATHAKLVPEDKIKVAFWGVDSQRFTPDWGWQEEHISPLQVLFVGSDPVRKGLFYLYQAIKGLPGVELTVVGMDMPVPQGVSNVRVLGMVPNSQMPEVMRQAHCVAVPSLEDGIACAVQEGTASGLVPITSPDCAEVFDPGVEGFRVGWRDVGGIRDAIVKLRDDPALREQMARAARAKAERQTWQKFKDEFKACIQEVLGG